MKTTKYIILLSFCLALQSCGGGAGKPSKISFVSGAISAGDRDGGLMVYGMEINTNKRFAKKININDSEITLNIENQSGLWKFYAFAWDDNAGGSSNKQLFKGNLSCAKVSKNIEAGESNIVELTLSKTNCNHEEYVEEGGWDPDTNSMGMLELKMCNPGSSLNSLISNQQCPGGSYAGGVTGIRLKLPEYPLGDQDHNDYKNPMVSECIQLSMGAGQSYRQLPFGLDSDLPIATEIELFYGPSLCMGESCCSGHKKSTLYSFGIGRNYNPQNVESYLKSYGEANKLHIIDPAPENKVHFIGAALGAMTTNSCQAIQAEYTNLYLTPQNAPKNLTVPLNCANGTCQFYSDDNCLYPTSSATITIGTNQSALVYIKSFKMQSLISIPVTSDYTGEMRAETVTVPYADINASMLFAANPIQDIGSYFTFLSAAINDYGFYQTNLGNRGKIIITDIDYNTISDDQITFDFITWNSAGAVVASGTNKVVTACATGNCFLDLDAPNPINSINGPEDEVWWKENLGSLYFMQQSGILRKF